MWEALIKQLLDAQRELELSLVQYPPDDMAKFNRIVGRHEGLSQALATIQQLVKDDEEKY
jgi:hypothetical protein